jgi:hypothetical protein
LNEAVWFRVALKKKFTSRLSVDAICGRERAAPSAEARDRAPGYDAFDAMLLERKNGALAPTLAIRGEGRLGRGVPDEVV